MAANKYRGEVTFPAEYYGPGVVIRFRSGDLALLEEKYGPNYRSVIWTGLIDQRRASILADCIRYGLKKQGTGEQKFLGEKEFEDLPFSHDAVAHLFGDALFMAWHGKTATEFALEAERLAAEAKAAEEATLDDEEGDERRPPTTGSSGFSTTPLEPDFSPTLSGD